MSEAAPTGDPEPLPPVASDIALASDDVLDTEAIPFPDTVSSPASESALSSSALFSPAPSYSAPSTSTPCSSTSSYISAAEMVREAPSTSMSREASASSTATLPLSSDPTYDILVAEQSKLSQEDKVWLLKRHELLLGPPKVKMFEDLYVKNLLHCPNTEFQAWLLLKQQAVGIEAEALECVLSSRKPKQVPKKKTTRKLDLPEGGDRYDPMSKGYEEYFARTEARKNKRKVTAPDPPPGVNPTKFFTLSQGGGGSQTYQYFILLFFTL